MALVFITGGVRSGKSAFAEQFVRTLGQQLNSERLVYLATGVATDTEMQKRINRHQQDRKRADEHWHTIEAPYAIEEALYHLKPGDMVLWDCATTWLTNCLFEGYDMGAPCLSQPGCVERKIANMKEAVLKTLEADIPLVIVSNELLDEASSIYEEAELYRKYLGEIHQWFVAQATEIYELDYGIAKKWK